MVIPNAELHIKGSLHFFSMNYLFFCLSLLTEKKILDFFFLFL